MAIDGAGDAPDFRAIQAFIAVAEAQSFTRATRTTGLSRSALRKALSRLEARLGTRLLHRTTRKVTLTADGAQYLGRMREIMLDLPEAEAVVRPHPGRPPASTATSTSPGPGSPISMGAHETINVRTNSVKLEPYAAEKGTFDLAFECSAAPAAFRSASACLRPQGTLIAVGVGSEVPIPLNLVVGKELNVVGTHRFVAEYAEAVDLIDRRAIDVRPIISAQIDLAQAAEAFELASDRTQAVKVQLTFAAG